MSFIACLNRLCGRKGGFGKGGLVKGNSPEAAKCYQIPRKYKVPDGLKARVLELLGNVRDLEALDRKWLPVYERMVKLTVLDDEIATQVG